MNSDRNIWRLWVNALHSWGLDEAAASVLDVAGPLTVLGAQAVYIGQPMFNAIFPHDHLDALARMLEDPEMTTAFKIFLREGAPQ